MKNLILCSTLVAVLALSAGLLASPAAAQSSPTLVPPADDSEWMWGQSMERVLGQFRVRSVMGGGYPPQQRCAMALITGEGDVAGYAVADEPVRVEEGMSGAQACAPLLDGTAQRLYPGTDVFMEGDYLMRSGLTLTGDFFYDNGQEVDGYVLADEVNAWGTMGAKPEEEILPGRIADPNAVWLSLLIFFMPADGVTEDYQARPLIIDMNPERKGR